MDCRPTGKEGRQRMNDINLYHGEKYSFRRQTRIGRGGNGAVYEVSISEIPYPVVAKFFEYGGNSNRERYNRFVSEISIMSKLNRN